MAENVGTPRGKTLSPTAEEIEQDLPDQLKAESMAVAAVPPIFVRELGLIAAALILDQRDYVLTGQRKFDNLHKLGYDESDPRIHPAVYSIRAVRASGVDVEMAFTSAITDFERMVKDGSIHSWVNLGKRLPERNAPCPCGSGKKFKKCCLPLLSQS